MLKALMQKHMDNYNDDIYGVGKRVEIAALPASLLSVSVA